LGTEASLKSIENAMILWCHFHAPVWTKLLVEDAEAKATARGAVAERARAVTDNCWNSTTAGRISPPLRGSEERPLTKD